MFGLPTIILENQNQKQTQSYIPKHFKLMLVDDLLCVFWSNFNFFI